MIDLKGNEMTGITGWEPAYDWEAGDATAEDDAMWYSIVPCDGEQHTGAGWEECTDEAHELAVAVSLTKDGLAVMYDGPTLCYIMDGATARFLVENMDPESAYEWASEHSVSRSWGMPYYLDPAAEAGLVGAAAK